MRKILASLLTTAVIASASPAFAFRGTTEKCFQMNPFADQLRLIFQDKVVGHQLVYGTWTVPGFYAYPVSGAYELDVNGGPRLLSIVGSNTHAAAGGGNQLCSISGTIDGSFTLQCTGGTGGNFQTSGEPLTQIKCGGGTLLESGRQPALSPRVTAPR